ncbi:MAG: heparinase II/III family protein [Bacteroidales bacterium]|nr:heparinase II/III family protein [Bacteroidales bacterium]
MRRVLLSVISVVLAVCASGADLTGPGAHPRLLLPAGEEPLIDAGSLLARPDSVILAYSNAVLGTPPVERVMIGRRLLHTSREALKRIFWLSWTYHVHGGEAYARRAVEEMLAVSDFSDWNPSHFLDVGEMTMAVAIGYDWLYGEMTPEERKKIAGAILDKGLNAALDEGAAWFYTSEINWNSVCNAGMVYGALAVWEEAPEFCSKMLSKSLESNKLVYGGYSGGGYAEGYNYWGYGTSFQIMLEAAVETALPAIFQEPKPEGYGDFLASADFIRFTSTPAGNCFSFSDCRRKAVGQYMQAWMAGHGGSASLLYPEIRIMEDTGYSSLCEERLFPMYLISLISSQRQSAVELPSDHYYICGGRTPVFVYREGWSSRDDNYLGIKGGLTMSSHSHCDQGSFYFESDGVAWATDLGMQDYNSLESAGVDLWDMTWDSERWQVFRIGPFSHNILTVNGHVPNVSHPVDFRTVWMPERPSSGDRVGAVVDLTELYTEDLESCSRAVWMQGDDLHVVDLVQAGDSVSTVRWAMCTEAETVSLQPDGTSFELSSAGHLRVLSAEILDGEAYSFPSVPQPGRTEVSRLPVPAAGTWPVTYDPDRPDTDGMQYLHPTDEPNPGSSLIGYAFTLQAHRKVALHVILKKVD